MALKSDQLPNRMLNGEEIRKIAVQHLDQLLSTDCMFLRQAAYRRCAMKITATFHFGSPSGDYAVELSPRLGSELSRQLPLTPVEGEMTVLRALEREVSLENPNLQRVAHGLPITITERKPPEPVVAAHPIPGEVPEAILNPFPTVVTQEIRYHPENFERPPEPVDTDVTAREATKLGLEPPPVVPEPVKERKRA